MIKLADNTIGKDDINALIKWLNQDPVPILTKNKLTLNLEKEWVDIIGTKYSVYVNSGSSAILLLLAALKVQKKYNNQIIVPALSWITDVSSPMFMGFTPVLCDCNLTDLSCDLNYLEDLFKKYGNKRQSTLFISVAPLGLVPRIDDILILCDIYNITLIEDNCESMGSKYKGQMLGGFGLASCFSMYYGHHISSIEGGLINTNDDDLYNLLLSIRSHGWSRDLPAEEQERLRQDWNTNEFNELYTFYYPGLNLRSTDLQAFIALRQINKLHGYCQARNKNFMLYNNLLKDHNKLNLYINDNDFISNFAYPMVHENKKQIINELRKNNIEVRPLIAGNIGNQPFWINEYGYQSLKNADIIDKYGFYLPNHQNLKEEDINFIYNVIKNHI